MANKGRVLYLLRYLQQCSDEDHPVTTAEIRKELADKGCPATVETVRDDISMIRGMDAVILAVAHTAFINFTMSEIDKFFGEGKKVLLDLKGLLNRKEYEAAGYSYWRL